MTQSVELLLDAGSEASVLAEWAHLADAGLPTEQRAVPSATHLVRQVVANAALLELQAGVAKRCGTEPDSHFAAGRWSPHVTLARRVPVQRLGLVVATLGELPDIAATSRTCRRWGGDAKVAWDLT